jgi:lysophospholipase
MAPFMLKYISARDGTRLRTGVFEPEKKSGKVCVLLAGQTEFIEKYYEVIGELNARGFVAATFDWRGQGGSTRALSDPLKVHVRDFSEFDDDLQSFMEQVVTPLSPATPMVLAHSMGGNVALRAMHDKPGLFRAAILSAPMQGIATQGIPSGLVRSVAALQNFAGESGAFVWGVSKRDPFRTPFEDQLGTSDVKRYARTQDFFLANPQIRLTGPTWGWMRAAFRAIRRQASPGFAEAIRTPTLVIGAGRDRIVPIETVRAFAARLPDARYVELAESEHEILMERDEIRARFWDEFDDFVEERSGFL